MYYTGGTLMVDHGYGLQSAFLHLSKLLVSKGQHVKQGDVIALSGMSGRATGPHLDWRMNWFDARVDAEKIAQPMPALVPSPAPSAEPSIPLTVSPCVERHPPHKQP